MTTKQEKLRQIYQDIDECKECTLANLPQNYPKVRPRGSVTEVTLVGTAPGKIEEQQNRYFTGPAGQLLDRMMKSINIDTNRGTYLTNVLKCRSKALPGSGKENITPPAKCVKTCVRNHFFREINTLEPKVIIMLGKIAIDNTLQLSEKEAKKSTKILLGLHPPSDWMPDSVEWCYALYHPSAMLYIEKGDDRMRQMKQVQWEHLKEIRRRLNG